MSVKLSATIVAYNNYRDITEALMSLEKFTDSAIEKKIYIVDNGMTVSSESSIKEFKRFIAQYEDITYIDAGKNLGFGKGHNLVLPQLNSEYHAIVNPDILFTEDAFKTIIDYMDSHGNVGMCIPQIVDEQGELQQVYRKEVTVPDMFIRMFCKKLFPKRVADHTLQDQDYTKPFRVPFGQGSFLVIKTALFKELNGFDDAFFMYLEDADLCKRVNQVSNLIYLPDATVIHKWEQGSHKNMKLFKYHVKSMGHYFSKWGFTERTRNRRKEIK